jgi:hypothetical protein
MISSLWANIYEDVVKYLSSDPSYNQPPQLSLFKTRIILLTVFSFLFILLMLKILPILVTMIWNKFKCWIREIDVEKLTCNALAPTQSARQ